MPAQKGRFFSFSILKRMFAISIPSTIQQCSVSIGNILVQSVINGYGAGIVAGTAAAYKLNTFATTCLCSVLNAATSFTAQNMGAGKPQRVLACRRSGLLMLTVTAIPIAAIFFFFGENLLHLFISNPSEEALCSGANFLRIVSPFYLIIQFKFIDDALLRGSGAMKYYMIDTGTDLALRVIFSYIFSSLWGFTGIPWSWNVGWIFGAALAEIFVHKGVWKRNLC